MSFRTFNVQHRLYAYTESQSGAMGGGIVPLGVVDASRNVPPHILQAVDELLASIAPAGPAAAYAVKRFGASGEIGSSVCLVTSHPYVDALDRPAPLNHARILRIDSADAWLDIHALVDLAVAFESDGVLSANRGPEGIRDHLLDVETSVPVAEWSEEPFEEVENGLAQTVIEMAVSRVNSEDSETVPLPPQSSLLALRGAAAAWASLPVAIQRACSFSIDATPGTRAKILFTTSGSARQPKVTEKARSFAASYIQWLHDRPDDARSLIMNPEVSDALTLVTQFERARAPRTIQREERTMPKSKRPPDAPRGQLDATVTTYINAQVAAAEESIRESMKKWVGAIEQSIERSPSVPRQSGGGFSQVRRTRGWRELASTAVIGALAGALAAFVVVFAMRPHAAAPASRSAQETEPAVTQTFPTTTQEVISPVQPLTKTPADKLAGADWAHRFQTLSDTDPRRLAAVMDSIAANGTGDQSASLAKIRQQIDDGKPLEAADRKTVRAMLFQMLAQQISGGNFKIDGKFESVPAAAVKALRTDLGLESKRPAADLEIANLEAEAILKWAARRGL